MSKRLFLALIGLSLLPGCGFKLRGSYQLSTALIQLSIEGGKRELVERLTRILMDNGITVVDAGSDSPTLILSRSEFNRKTVGTDADGIATEYEYNYHVDFRVSDVNGEVLLPLSSISRFNTLNYDVGNELEIEEEEKFLKESMEKDIVLQIVRELSRI